MPDIATINHVGVTVTDIERSTPWYSQVFGFTKLMEETHPDGTGRVVVLGKPDWSTCIGLHTHPANANESFSETRTGLDHVAFLVPNRADLDNWQAHLADLAVDHSPVNDRPGYSVLVFRDPDNIQLELISMG
jgi:catechol-2,3-dioxygenase